jgi:hypothetical protein
LEGRIVRSPHEFQITTLEKSSGYNFLYLSCYTRQIDSYSSRSSFDFKLLERIIPLDIETANEAFQLFHEDSHFEKNEKSTEVLFFKNVWYYTHKTLLMIQQNSFQQH